MGGLYGDDYDYYGDSSPYSEPPQEIKAKKVSNQQNDLMGNMFDMGDDYFAAY